MADAQYPERRRRAPEFDNKFSIGTVINILGMAAVAGFVWATVTGQQESNTLSIEALGKLITDTEDEIAKDVTAIRSTVNSAVSRLEREIDNDLDEVAQVVEEADEKLDQVITEQTTAIARLGQAEEDIDDLETDLQATRGITLQVRSDASRDRAVQATRHDSLVEALDEIKQTIRSSN